LQLFKGCIVSPSALMDIVDAVQEAPARNKAARGICLAMGLIGSYRTRPAHRGQPST